MPRVERHANTKGERENPKIHRNPFLPKKKKKKKKNFKKVKRMVKQTLNKNLLSSILLLFTWLGVHIQPEDKTD